MEIYSELQIINCILVTYFDLKMKAAYHTCTETSEYMADSYLHKEPEILLGNFIPILIIP